MKSTHKLGQRLWELITIQGNRLSFDGQMISLTIDQVNGNGYLNRCNTIPYYSLNYTPIKHPEGFTTYSSPNIAYCKECFDIGFYTSKQGHSPDIPT